MPKKGKSSSWTKKEIATNLSIGAAVAAIVYYVYPRANSTDKTLISNTTGQNSTVRARAAVERKSGTSGPKAFAIESKDQILSEYSPDLQLMGSNTVSHNDVMIDGSAGNAGGVEALFDGIGATVASGWNYLKAGVVYLDPLNGWFEVESGAPINNDLDVNDNAQRLGSSVE